MSKTLKQTKIFAEVERAGLSPNQYYILCCIHDNKEPLRINQRLDFRALRQKEWLTDEDQLTKQAVDLVTDMETRFISSRAKTPRQLMGEGYKEKIAEYRLMFPPGYRNSAKNLLTKFTWFFRNHDYNWETIFKATELYIADQLVRNNHKYLQQSQYFIKKHDLSNLDNWCDKVKSGTAVDRRKARFKTRVKQ